jgi:hypothetical protein
MPNFPVLSLELKSESFTEYFLGKQIKCGLSGGTNNSKFRKFTI